MVAKGLMLCSQDIILAIWMEFPPKEQQFSLLLTRKEKHWKCQEIPAISAGGKTLLFLPWWMESQTRLVAVDYLDRKWCSGSFSTPKWQLLLYSTGNSQLCHLYRQILCHPWAPPPNPKTKTNRPKCLPKGVDSTTKTRKWASTTLLWSPKPLISCGYPSFQKGPHPSQLFSWQVPKATTKPTYRVPLA